ncbi:MAG: hydrogen gas-evolving membrane-bound hydrogenase subunit E [Candidatus Hadarchaeales archaeon]
MKRRELIATAAVVALLLLLLLVVHLALPPFGSFPAREIGENSVATVYLENAVSQTGSVNVVTSIVWGYRGYDTLGEATILFAATIGVLAVLRSFRGKE